MIFWKSPLFHHLTYGHQKLNFRCRKFVFWKYHRGKKTSLSYRGGGVWSIIFSLLESEDFLVSLALLSFSRTSRSDFRSRISSNWRWNISCMFVYSHWSVSKHRDTQTALFRIGSSSNFNFFLTPTRSKLIDIYRFYFIHEEIKELTRIF